MNIYEAIWKTLFIIRAVETTKNDNMLQLISAANNAYASNEETTPVIDRTEFYFNKTKEMLATWDHVTASRIQRVFRLEYPKAARIIDMLQEAMLISKEFDPSIGGYRVLEKR